jgi:hypothetical protein
LELVDDDRVEVQSEQPCHPFVEQDPMCLAQHVRMVEVVLLLPTLFEFDGDIVCALEKPLEQFLVGERLAVASCDDLGRRAAAIGVGGDLRERLALPGPIGQREPGTYADRAVVGCDELRAELVEVDDMHVLA